MQHRHVGMNNFEIVLGGMPALSILGNGSSRTDMIDAMKSDLKNETTVRGHKLQLAKSKV
jgi:bacterioferritin (cytochrome b1)